MLNQRTNLSKEMVKALNESVEFIKETFNIELKVFENSIPISVKTGEAILNKKSIIEYDPKNKVAEAYKNFAKEWSDCQSLL